SSCTTGFTAGSVTVSWLPLIIGHESISPITNSAAIPPTLYHHIGITLRFFLSFCSSASMFFLVFSDGASSKSVNFSWNNLSMCFFSLILPNELLCCPYGLQFSPSILSLPWQG